MAKWRNVRVLLGRGAGIVARAASGVIVDEIARMRYQQSVFDTMVLGLRLGDRPRALIATTPRTTPFMKRLVAMDDIRITTGSTYDNAEHLSAKGL